MADVLGRPRTYVVPASERKPIVTDWSGPEDYDNAPPSYDAFYRQYYTYTRHLVSKFGVPPSDFDDVIADIITRFIERDSIGVFRRDWSSRSATGTSGFRSYYSRFVVTYARGYTRNAYKHYEHYSLICDAPVNEDGTKTWIDEEPSTVEFESTLLETDDFKGLIQRALHHVDKELYGALFALLDLADQREFGMRPSNGHLRPIRANALIHRLGIKSPRKAYKLLRCLRQAIAEATYPELVSPSGSALASDRVDASS